MTAGNDAFHDALDRLTGTGYEFEGFLSNHGPMGCDALIELGAADNVPRWVDLYRHRLEVEPETRAPIDPAHDSWRSALGDITRVADWTAMFHRTLQETPWQEILGIWWPRLLPGLVAAATHGVIRTAHAVRGIDRAGTADELLLRELAHGLGYWAARYEELPVKRPSLNGDRSIPVVIGSLAAVNPGEDSGEPGIISTLRLVQRVPSFDDILATAGNDGLNGVLDAFTAVTTSAAHAFVAHPGPAIPMVHALTAPAAVKLILPHLPESLWPNSLAYSIQVSAAVVTMFATPQIKPVPTDVPKIENLIDRVIKHGDEHVIKMTEACLREYAIDPDPHYVLAAEAAANSIQPLTRWNA
jgi:hypothetical protein